MIAGPLFTAQQTASECRQVLNRGKNDALNTLSRRTLTTVEDLKEVLKDVPLYTVLQLFKAEEARSWAQLMLQAASDLDYVNDVIDMLVKYDSINPQMHAIISAYRRRAITGRFKTPNVPTDLECLRFSQVKRGEGSDGTVKEKGRQKDHSGRTLVCRAFQQGRCTFHPCKYRHVCAICYKGSHAAASCWFRVKRNQSRETKSNQEEGHIRSPSRPPHPRHRRSRATKDVEKK